MVAAVFRGILKLNQRGFAHCGVNPLFPFPDRLSSVFSALGEKANS
jgi:hypothetical protein